MFGGRFADELHRAGDREAGVDDAQARRRDPEPGARVGQAEVARDGDLGATADAGAPDERDARLGKLRQGPVGELVGPGVLLKGQVAQTADVAAGAEVVTDTAHHEDPNGRVGPQLGRQRREL